MSLVLEPAVERELAPKQETEAVLELKLELLWERVAMVPLAKSAPS